MSEPASARPRAAALARLTRRNEPAVKAGDAKAVVRLVERWGEEADLPRDARLAAQLSTSSCSGPRLGSTHELRPAATATSRLGCGEMFIERGWPDRARRPLERISRLTPDHPKLAGGGATGAAPQAPPTPSSGRGGPEALMDLAEVYLRTGSILRAQGILERLRRGGGGDQDRVEMLLWGVRGDFSGW